MKQISTQKIFCSCAAAITSIVMIPTAYLAVYGGGGIEQGAETTASDLGVSETTDLRGVIGNIVNTALSYAALLAVAVIIIAGFYLVLGLGSSESQDKAKKIVLYTVIGLIVILFSKAIVVITKSLIL